MRSARACTQGDREVRAAVLSGLSRRSAIRAQSPWGGFETASARKPPRSSPAVQLLCRRGGAWHRHNELLVGDTDGGRPISSAVGKPAQRRTAAQDLTEEEAVTEREPIVNALGETRRHRGRVARPRRQREVVLEFRRLWVHRLPRRRVSKIDDNDCCNEHQAHRDPRPTGRNRSYPRTVTDTKAAMWRRVSGCAPTRPS